jgi:Thioredoxin/Vitamin K epoxide reductase family
MTGGKPFFCEEEDERSPAVKKNMIIRGALITGLVLAVASEVDFCSTSACTEAHQYTLFGIPFAFLGIGFFVAAWTVFECSRFFRLFPALFFLMICGAGGAEAAFILIQKYQIKQWCPLCLGVAAVVYFLVVLISVARVQDAISKFRERKVTLMKIAGKVLIVFLVVFSGFGLAYKGAQKSEAGENIPDISLGNKRSSVEVYIFTDWFCPACRKAEREIEKTVPVVGERAKIIFVDLPIHEQSLNYTPFGLSFLVYEKAKYLELRRALMTVTLKTKEPTPEQVQEAVTPLHVTYKPLAFLTVSRMMKVYSDLAKTFKVKSTPTVVVYEAKTKQSIRLVGAKEITETRVLGALADLQRK